MNYFSWFFLIINILLIENKKNEEIGKKFKEKKIY